MEKTIRNLRRTCIAVVVVFALIAMMLLTVAFTVIPNAMAYYDGTDQQSMVLGFIFYYSLAIISSAMGLVCGVRVFGACDDLRMAKRFPKDAEVAAKMKKMMPLLYVTAGINLVNIVAGIIMVGSGAVVQLVSWIACAVLMWFTRRVSQCDTKPLDTAKDKAETEANK